MTEELNTQKPLPVGSTGKRSLGFWGVWMLILTEGSLFGYLLLSYFYLYVQSKNNWPPEGKPEMLMPGINTVILVSSSFFVWWGEYLIKRNKSRVAVLPQGIAIILGAIFVGVQVKEWFKKSYGISNNIYGSLYFTITGFHMAHVVIGLIIIFLLLLWTWLGFFSKERHAAVQIGGLYWHFVDVVWLVIFSCLYVYPYMEAR